MFAKDRDLVRLEPRLFDEVAWVGQEVTRGDAAEVSADGLSAEDYTGAFDAPGLGPGSVLRLNGVPVEVVALDHGVGVSFSMIRASDDDPVRPVSGIGAGATVECHTFAPQIAEAHRVLMAGFGLAVGATPEGGAPAADRVVNGRAMARLEALAALHMAYSAAAPLVDRSSVVWRKALLYRDRLAAERRAAVAEVDTDGDGVADAARRMSAVRLVRG